LASSSAAAGSAALHNVRRAVRILLSHRGRFPFARAADLHGMLSSLSDHIASRQWVSRPVAFRLSVLNLLTQTAAAFLARRIPLRVDEKKQLQATLKSAADDLTEAEQLQRRAPAASTAAPGASFSGASSGAVHAADESNLRGLIPLLQFHLSFAVSVADQLPDNFQLDVGGLAAAVVATAASFFGVGESQAGVLVSAAVDAVKKKAKHAYGGKLFEPAMQMAAEAHALRMLTGTVEPPLTDEDGSDEAAKNFSVTSVEKPAAAIAPRSVLLLVRSAMAAHGEPLRIPSLDCRWEVNVGYLHMLHDMLHAVHQWSKQSDTHADEAAQATELLLRGGAGAPPLVGLSAAVDFRSSSPLMINNEWRPTECVAYISHCIAAAPMDYPAEAQTFAEQQLAKLRLRTGDKVDGGLLAHTVYGRAVIARVQRKLRCVRPRELDAAEHAAVGVGKIERKLDAMAAELAARPKEAAEALADETVLSGKLPLLSIDLSVLQSRYVTDTRLSLFSAFAAWSSAVCDPSSSTAAAPASSRVFWLLGDPGIGKSVFAAQCAKQFGHCIVATHFIRAGNADSRQAKKIVRSIAHQLATRLPTYRAHLLKMVLPSLPDDGGINAAGLFGRLLTTALKECYPNSTTAPAELVTGRSEGAASAEPHSLPRLVLLLDALDEGESDLLPLLSSEVQWLPRWLSLMVTSRPEQPIRDALASHKPKELYCSQDENQEDIEKFLRGQLADVATATGEPLDPLVGKLLEMSGGQFLYARLLVTEVRENPSADLRTLPTDLSGYYADSMSRLKEHSSAARFTQLFAVIEAVCTFYLPPSLTLLAEFVHKRCAVNASVPPAAAAVFASPSASAEVLLPPEDLSDAETRSDAMRRLLLPLSSLFPFDEASGSVAVYHKTVSDFFTDQRRKISQPDTTVHPTAVHKLIAEICVQQMRTPKSAQSMHAAEAAGSVGAASAPAAAAASATASSSSAAGSSALPSLPWLRLLKMDAAVTDSARASAGPPSPSAAWLRYAACFAAEHAVAAQSVPLAIAFLSHPQYLHMRALYQEHASYLSSPYTASIARAEEEQRTREEADEEEDEKQEQNEQEAAGAKNNAYVCLTSSPLRRSLHLPILRAFYRLYLQHGRRWAAVPELVYQYAAAFPDDLPPARLAQQMIPWLSKWKQRKCAVMQWENKLQQLSELIGTLSGHTFEVVCVAYSSDGKRIVTGSYFDTVVWDAIDLTKVAELTGHSLWVISVSFSPDGRRIVSGGEDNSVRVWDAVNFALLATLKGHTSKVLSVSYSGDGKRMASASSDGTIRVWDAVSFAPIGTMARHRAVTSVAFSPDATRIVSGSVDKTVRVWDAATLAELKMLEDHFSVATSVAFSPDGGRIIISVDEVGVVRTWDATSFMLLHKMECSDVRLRSVAFSPDGARFAVGGDDKRVRLFDAHTFKLLKSFIGHHGSVSGVTFSPDGARIVSASADKTVRVWDATDLREAKACGGHSSSVHSLALSSDGRRIVSGSDPTQGGNDTSVRVWDAQTGDEIRVLNGHGGAVSVASISADGIRIFSAAGSTIRVWDAENSERLASLSQFHSPTALAVNADASRIAVGGPAMLHLWNAQSFEEITSINLGEQVLSIAFNPNGKHIAAICSSGHFFLLNGNDLVPIAQFYGLRPFCINLGRHDWIFLKPSIAFSPDGGRFVVGSGANTMRMWAVNEFKPIASFEGHTAEVTSMCFSGDGRFIVSGSEDCTVRVWCARRFRELRVLTGHIGAVRSVTVNHDGSCIVSAGDDRLIRCWSLLVPVVTGSAAGNPLHPCHFASDNSGLLRLCELC
jgi:WD40 repeat protein